MDRTFISTSGYRIRIYLCGTTYVKLVYAGNALVYRSEWPAR